MPSMIHHYTSDPLPISVASERRARAARAPPKPRLNSSPPPRLTATHPLSSHRRRSTGRSISSAICAHAAHTRKRHLSHRLPLSIAMRKLSSLHIRHHHLGRHLVAASPPPAIARAAGDSGGRLCCHARSTLRTPASLSPLARARSLSLSLCKLCSVVRLNEPRPSRRCPATHEPRNPSKEAAATPPAVTPQPERNTGGQVQPHPRASHH